MIAKTVTVSDKGQIALPVSIRKDMGIEKGDELVIIHKNGTLYLEKLSSLIKHFDKEDKEYRKFVEMSLKDTWDNEVNDIWNKTKNKSKRSNSP